MSGEQQRNEPETGAAGDNHRSRSRRTTDAGGEADSAGRSARILILEDEAWDAELAQRLLAGAGLSLRGRRR